LYQLIVERKGDYKTYKDQQILGAFLLLWSLPLEVNLNLVQHLTEYLYQLIVERKGDYKTYKDQQSIKNKRVRPLHSVLQFPRYKSNLVVGIYIFILPAVTNTRDILSSLLGN